MTIEKLNEILEEHKLWLRNEGGSRADLSGANLRYADLSGANLRYADLSDANLRYANLRYANLSDADLSGANLRYADLSGANLRYANLRYANLSDANLSDADLSGANLRYADLSDADLSGANLSGAKGIKSTVDFMEAHFERVPEGYVAYKTFGGQYTPPSDWDIKPGSVISENVNFDRCRDCGCGVNVAPLNWVKANYKGDVWKVLIRWEWLCGVCVPYHSDGKIRCERVELLEIVTE